MEGNWETRGNVPLVLFAMPDEEARENRFEIAIPSGASLILTHRCRRRGAGAERLRGRGRHGAASAGGAGVLRLPGDGRHRAS
jgi:cytochrome bd-type quinol oxidase subunit 1